MPHDADDAARNAGLAWACWYDGLHRARQQCPPKPRVVRAKHYIDRCFVDGVLLDHVASEARLSKYHFVRAFRDICRRTPHRYLVERRIRRARELLERTDLSVTAVCFEVGFESLGSFVARIRQLVGEPPGQYRRRFARHGPIETRAVPACLYEAFAMRPARPAGSPAIRNSEEA